MKKEQNKKQVFRVKLSILIIILSIACILLCLAGIVVSIVKIIQNQGLHTFNDYLKYPFYILVCVACITIIISIYICAHYAVGNNKLITRFGIIKSTYNIQDFTALSVDLKTNKLTVFQGENYFVLTLNPKWKDEFIRAIVQEKPSLVVSYQFKDDTPPKEEPKDQE